MNTLYYESDYLMHHGIKGMKWGVRRYQNEDGSLTSAGKRKYGTPNPEYRNLRKAINRAAITSQGSDKKKHARAVQKVLNTADQYRAEESYRARRYEKKANRTLKKLHNAEAKGNTEAAEKLKLKWGLEGGRVTRSKGHIEFAQQLIADTTKLYSQNGFSIQSKYVRRQVDKGRTAVALLASGGSFLTYASTSGTKYKVRHQ